MAIDFGAPLDVKVLKNKKSLVEDVPPVPEFVIEENVVPVKQGHDRISNKLEDPKSRLVATPEMALGSRKMGKRMLAAIDQGDMREIQRYFIDNTRGFWALLTVANGRELFGEKPSIKEVISANQIIIDKVFPSLKASQVIQDFNVTHNLPEMSKDEMLAGLEELRKQMEVVG